MGTYKKGLDYFSFDTNHHQDLRVKCLKRRFGCEGLAIFTYLVSEIFRVEGYWLSVTPELLFDTADYLDVDEERTRLIIDECCTQGLFDADTYRQHGVLTSEEIQMKYFTAIKKLHRKVQPIHEMPYLLHATSDYLSKEKSDFSPKSSQSSEQNNNRTDKRKERKGKEIPLQTPPESRDSERLSAAGDIFMNKDGGISGPLSSPTPPTSPSSSSYPLPPNDRVERNYEGLVNNFIRFRVEYDDAISILRLSNYGQLGHPVWKAIYSLSNNPGKFNAPGKFILSQIRGGYL